MNKRYKTERGEFLRIHLDTNYLMLNAFIIYHNVQENYCQLYPTFRMGVWVATTQQEVFSISTGTSLINYGTSIISLQHVTSQEGRHIESVSQWGLHYLCTQSFSMQRMF